MLNPKININFMVNAGDNGWLAEKKSRTRSREGFLLLPALELQALSTDV
jgi:hypothetical protein